MLPREETWYQGVGYARYCGLFPCNTEQNRSDNARPDPLSVTYLLLHMEKQHGKGKALTVLAHKLAQTVYYMLKRGVVFDFNTFLQSYGRRAGKPAA